MSSETATRIYNTRERLTSTDLNRTADLSARQVQELMGALASTDVNRSGVLTGLTMVAAISPGALQVTVSPGLAAFHDPSTVYPDSPWRWVELREAVNVSLPTGTGHDRWVAIEIAPGSAVTQAGVIVDEWDPTIPPSGNFVSAAVDKERQSTPVFTATEGTDNSPNPANFPLGTSGKIPLGYIFMDAADNISSTTAGIVQCRPVLRPVGAHDPDVEIAHSRSGSGVSSSLSSVEGGGIKVNSVNATSVSVDACQGRFARANVGFRCTSASIDILNDNAWNNGNLGRIPDASTGVVYVYAVPPPYPPGYDAMAEREFIVGSAVQSKFDTGASNVLVNCILLLSTSPPANGLAGSPFATGLVADWPFRNGVSFASSDAFSWVYLGAFDFGPDGVGDMSAKQQTHEGGGIISLTQRGPYTDIESGALGDGAHDLRVRSLGADNAGTGNLPTSAKVLETVFRATFNSVPIGEFLEVFIDDSQSAAEVHYVQTCPVVTAGFEISHPMRIVQNGSTVSFTVDTEPANMSTFGPHVVGYVDSILAKR